MDALSYNDKVAVITGAGGGLGRAYALLFGSRGAKVVVNDLGGDTKGEGKSTRAADLVVEEIKKAGGIAVANYDSVEAGEKIIQTALDNFGRVDILVNNAGILRDRSFPRTSDMDWDLVHKVHLRGSFQVTRAAFPVMKKQGYGRIIMTASTSGIFGNFGQANYSAAKLGLMGLSNTVAIEGQKYNIHCNTIAPFSGTRMTQGILPPDLFDEFKPELVAPLVAWLCHHDCNDTGGLYTAGGGWFCKFRWENSQGAVCRDSMKAPVTPEAVRDNWEKICDFTDSEHLASNGEITAQIVSALTSLNQPTMTQQPTPAIKGPASAVGMTLKPTPYSFTSKDLILYALGVGVSTKDEDALKFLYENSEDFAALSTFSIVPSQAAFMISDFWSSIPGWTPDLSKLLHGEMYVENLAPLPTSGTLTTTTTVADVLDKGSGAVMIIDTMTRNEGGEEVSRAQWSLFVVGEGNFGGPRTSKATIPLQSPPARAPDTTKECHTHIDQAALYRLNGDYNPLHIDPSFAAMGGFDKPILHGLCSFGITARAILTTYCGGDTNRFKAMKARFAKPVLPGQTLIVDMWHQGCRIFFTTTIKETGQPCLTGGFVDITEEAAKSEGPGIEENGVAASVFKKMADQLSNDPMLASKVNATFLWIIKKTDNTVSKWTVDLKGTGKGIYQGPPQEGTKPDVTLTIDESDLGDLVGGKLNPQVAFTSGKLKVAGNVMLTQRLQPLLTPRSRM